MSLANQVIDFVDDVQKVHLRSIAGSLPEHLKTAQVVSAAEQEALDDSQFALILWTKEAQQFRKFPIHDAGNTWLSCQYFEKTAEQLPYVAKTVAATQLAKACALHKLATTPEVKKFAAQEVYTNRYDEVRSWKDDRTSLMTTKIASATPSDGSEHFYALGGRYAMPTPDYVKKAAAYFAEHAAEFTDAEDRHTFAHNVIERAKELSVQVECLSELSKYAGASYGDSVSTQLKLRSDLLHSRPEMAGALDKLASFKAETPAETFAKALYLFDKKAGIDRYYGSGYIADAFKATFADFQKHAGYHWENSDGSVSIAGKELTKAAEAKYDRIKTYLGPTLADSLKKEAVTIFDSLPNDAKETVVRICKGEL